MLERDKNDFLYVFVEFYENGVIGMSMNSNVIILMSKKDRLIKVRDFRFISFVI